MGSKLRLGIVGGNGWLGTAIAQAVIDSGWIEPSGLVLSSRSDKRSAELPGVNWTKDNQDLVDRSDVIVLSVRPDQFDAVTIRAHRKLVISVMAGITADVIQSRTQADEVVRSIPNAAASIRLSFTPWYATHDVSEDSKKIVQSLFEACGDAAEVPLESYIDYCVGMTGSGAAFPALLAKAMAAHAVTQGLPVEFAIRAAKGVIVGASQLLSDCSVDPSTIVQEMIDYRGTTCAALETMERKGFGESVAAGLEAAAAKATSIR
jgi:pyrroline-5-carboxylate reductase